jgi:hypothetical protein
LGYEDAEHLIRIVTSSDYVEYVSIYDIDKFREWGYAVPFRGVLVESMIEEGILKLKEQ